MQSKHHNQLCSIIAFTVTAQTQTGKELFRLTLTSQSRPWPRQTDPSGFTVFDGIIWPFEYFFRLENVVTISLEINSRDMMPASTYYILSKMEANPKELSGLRAFPNRIISLKRKGSVLSLFPAFDDSFFLVVKPDGDAE